MNIRVFVLNPSSRSSSRNEGEEKGEKGRVVGKSPEGFPPVDGVLISLPEATLIMVARDHN